MAKFTFGQIAKEVRLTYNGDKTDIPIVGLEHIVPKELTVTNYDINTNNTFTKSPDGTEDWIVYHVKRYVEDGWDNRDAFIQKFTWDKSGYPVFGEPVGWQEEIEVPSGEPL